MASGLRKGIKVYAVIESGGKQHKVEVGQELTLERLEGKPGQKIEFNKVLFLSKNGEEVYQGKDLAKAKVKATLLAQFRAKKIVVFKYKPKKNYRRKKGHRQLLTKVRIDEIIMAESSKKGRQASSSKSQAKKKSEA